MIAHLSSTLSFNMWKPVNICMCFFVGDDRFDIMLQKYSDQLYYARHSIG